MRGGGGAVSRTQSYVEGILTGPATVHPGRRPAPTAPHASLYSFSLVSCREQRWPDVTGWPSDAVRVGEQGEEAGRPDTEGRAEVTGTKESLALQEGRSVRGKGTRRGSRCRERDRAARGRCGALRGRRGVAPRREDAAVRLPSILWEPPSPLPSLQGVQAGPRHGAPPLSAAGSHQGESLCPGHRARLREGRKLSPSECSLGTPLPRPPAREENCLLPLKSGCWEDVELGPWAALSPLSPGSENIQQRGGIRQGGDAAFWATLP